MGQSPLISFQLGVLSLVVSVTKAIENKLTNADDIEQTKSSLIII